TSSAKSPPRYRCRMAPFPPAWCVCGGERFLYHTQWHRRRDSPPVAAVPAKPARWPIVAAPPTPEDWAGTGGQQHARGRATAPPRTLLVPLLPAGVGYRVRLSSDARSVYALGSRLEQRVDVKQVGPLLSTGRRSRRQERAMIQSSPPTGFSVLV